MKRKSSFFLLILLLAGGVWFGRDYLKQFPLFSSLFTLGNPVQEVSSSGLLRHFSMKTTGATTVIDETGTANATLSGAIPKPGAIGQALDFDGVDDSVDTGSDMIGTGDDSISAWIYADGYGEGTFGRIIDNGKFIVSLRESTGGNAKSLSLLSDGATIAESAINSILINQWYHVLITRTSAGTANIYINGVLSGSANQASGTPAAGTTNVIIGNNSVGARTFDGRIDELRLYNRILTASEITELYTQGNRVIANGVMTKGLVAHYSLAQEDLASASVLNDLTPNNRDGTITAGASAGFVADQTSVSAKAYDFDGANTKIATTLTSNTPFTNGFTISAWIKPDTLGEVLGSNKGMIVSKFATGANPTSIYDGFAWFLSDTNRLNAAVNGGAVRSSADNSITLGAWQHVLLTVASNATVTQYINGVVSGTPNTTNALSGITTSNPLTIGNRAGATDGTFDGAISDVKIYNRVLSAAEIRQLYQSYHPQGSTSSLEKGLIAHYPLSNTYEGTGAKQVTNGSLEGTYSGGMAPGWSELGTGGSDLITQSQETSSVHGGSSAQRAAIQYYGAAPAQSIGQLYSVLNLTQNKYYKLTFWARTATGSADDHMRVGVYGGNNMAYNPTGLNQSITLTETFQQYTYSFQYTGTNSTMDNLLFGRREGDTWGTIDFIIDDVSLTEVEAADSTPNARDGALYQDATIYGTDQKSVANGAMDFNGTSDKIDLGSAWNIGTVHTISFWMDYEDAGNGEPIGGSSASKYATFVSGPESGATISYGPDGGSGIYVTSDAMGPFASGVWNFITIVRNGTSVTFYKNGAQAGSAKTLGSNTALSLRYFGTEAGTSLFFQGKLSDVRIYNRVLTAEEIKLLYDQKE